MRATFFGRTEIVGASYPGPVIEPILLVFLFFGVGVLLGRCWDLLPYFCLVAAGLAFIPALVGPEFVPRRAIFVAPMLTILTVAGLVVVLHAVRGAFPSRAGTVFGVCLTVLVLATALLQDTRKYLKHQLPFWGDGVPNRLFGEFLVSLNDKYFVFIDERVGVADTPFFLLYAHYRENEYILSKYNLDPAVKPRPSHYRLHNFERDGLPVLPTGDRPVMYVLFRWDQRYNEIAPLVRRNLAGVPYEFREYQLAVPGSTFRYAVLSFTIPIESVGLINARRAPVTGHPPTSLPTAETSSFSSRLPVGTPVQFDTAVLAVHGRGLEALRNLLAEDPSLVHRADRNGWTLLHIAAGEGDQEIVRCLLRAGAPVDSTDGVGSTPLQKAIYFNRAEVVRVLLEHGADPSLKDRFGASAMDYAAGRLRIIEILERHSKSPVAP